MRLAYLKTHLSIARYDVLQNEIIGQVVQRKGKDYKIRVNRQPGR